MKDFLLFSDLNAQPLSLCCKYILRVFSMALSWGIVEYSEGAQQYFQMLSSELGYHSKHRQQFLKVDKLNRSIFQRGPVKSVVKQAPIIQTHTGLSSSVSSPEFFVR